MSVVDISLTPGEYDYIVLTLESAADEIRNMVDELQLHDSAAYSDTYRHLEACLQLLEDGRATE